MEAETEEYRKASIKVLGWEYVKRNGYEFYIVGTTDRPVTIPSVKPSPLDSDYLVMYLKDWQPNQNADHMLIVWDLIKGTGSSTELVEIMWGYANEDISLYDATMKAFMEYIKSIQ